MDFLAYLQAEGFQLPAELVEHHQAYAAAETELVGYLQQIIQLASETPPTPMEMLIIQALVALSKRETSIGSLHRTWVSEGFKQIDARLQALEESQQKGNN